MTKSQESVAYKNSSTTMKKSKQSDKSKAASEAKSKPVGSQDTSAASKEKAISNFKTKPTDVSAVNEAVPVITEMAIDKLYLDLSVSGTDMDAVLERAQQALRDKVLGKGSSKGTFFKKAFVLKFASKAVARFHIVPNNPGKGANMQLVLNPNQMKRSDCASLIKVFKLLFLFDAKEVAASMLIRRIDICLQLFGFSVNDAIITLDGSSTGAKVFVQTNRSGSMQTIYMGDVNSPHHGTAYDQVASDEYKSMVGEKPSRHHLKDIAELALEPAKKKEARTQLESRRNFYPAVGLGWLHCMSEPFGQYRILLLKRDDQKRDAGFCAYLDSVRLRGISGARLHLQSECGTNREARKQIAEYEARLGRMAAPWWKPDEYAVSLLETLKKSAAWHFLKVMEK